MEKRKGNEDGDGDGGACVETLPQRMSDVMPAHLLPCFKYETLTKVQQRVLRMAFKERGNMMVCAPTGSGKTTVLEAAFLQCHERSRGLSRGKAVYIAPVKALLQERLKDWRFRFGERTIGMSFVELSGDSTKVDDNEVADADVLLTTPEKWDAIMRNMHRSGLKPSPVVEIELLLVDEIHHIGDVSRGATLEAVLCRMMNIAKRERDASSGLPIEDLRIVGMSATFSNAEDLSSWIECPPASLFKFGIEFRPVPLTCRVIGCGDATNDFTFERNLDGRIAELIRQYSDGKPSLVFCNSRNATSRLAAFLGQELKRIGMFDAKKRDRVTFLDRLKERPSKKLEVSLQNGVAYHHAGLTASERDLVETLFKENKLLILCCTSSLAVGVNLPAHLVIIKSTRVYQGGQGYEEYPESQLLQMVGRAGRPGFDSSGTAIILAENNRVARLEKLTSGEAPIVIRSQLAASLLPVVNAEVDQGLIMNSTDAHTWIQSTFYASQLRREENWDAKAKYSEIDAVIERLDKATLVSLSGTGQISSTVAGSTMCQGYVKFSTMEAITAFEETRSTMADLLKVISCCAEVRLPLRRQEKATLNQLRESSVRHRLPNSQEKWTADSDEAKTNILLQAALSGASIPDERLVEESDHALSEAERLLGVMVEYLSSVGNAEALLITIRLQRCIRLRAWDDLTGRLSLKPACDDALIIASLEYIGIRSIRQLAQADSVKIDELLRRNVPIGKRLIDNARMLKDFCVSTAWLPKRRRSQRTLKISVLSAQYEQEGSATLLVWTTTKLLHHRAKIDQAYEHEIPVGDDCGGPIHIRLIHDKIPGLDTRLDIETETRRTRSPKLKTKERQVPVTSSRLTVAGEPTSEQHGSSSIMNTILQLERRHANARQQDISKFMTKKKKSTQPSPAQSTTKKRVAPSFARIPIEQPNAVLSPPRKRSRTEPKLDKHKLAQGLTKVEVGRKKGLERDIVSFDVTRTLKPKPATKSKAATNLFDKLRFKRGETKTPALSAPSSTPPSPVIEKVAEMAAPRSSKPDRSIFPVEQDHTNDRPFLRTYLRLKEEEQPVPSHGSLLQGARSSLEYSLLERFFNQDAQSVQDHITEEDDADDPFAAHIIPSEDDPFGYIFF